MSTGSRPATALQPPAVPPDAELSRQVELFLYHDAELLDSWQLRQWYELFTPDCQYLVPATDRPDGDPEHDLFFVRDDWFLLGQRVDAMVSGTAWTESPRSITSRSVSNVRAWPGEDGSVDVSATFVIHRSSLSTLDVYPGRYRMTLLPGGPAGFEIRYRRSTLALAQLRPHGRVSIIL